MKKKLSKVNKGAPSGFVISLAIHAAAFFLAGLFVVFTVTQKEEKKFVPPKPVDRPKMKLKKPKVKVKKSAKPKSTTRIVTKVQKANMPDIQLPEMSGMSEGLVGDIGGFEIMPEIEEMTVFGGGQTIGNDFVGTFYDLKRDRNGNWINGMDVYRYADELTKFCRSGWKPSVLARFYRAPKKLYTTTFAVPHVPSTMAPFAFNEPDTEAAQWVVHYTGKLVCHRDIKFRFWGHGDDILIVRVDGKIVLDGSWDSTTYCARNIAGKWVGTAMAHDGSGTFYLGNRCAWGGNWIELKAGEPLDMEVLMGEQPGGNFCGMLLIEEEGAEYETNPQNWGLFPIFRSAPTTHDVADAIMQYLVPGEADVLGGPVFQDYAPPVNTNAVVEVEPEVPVEPAVEEPASAMRLWTMKDGSTVEAEYMSQVGSQVALKNARGRQIKVAYNELSDEDIEFLKLSNPPKFEVGFLRDFSNYTVVLPTYSINAGHQPPRVLDYTFGATCKQKGKAEYNYELKLEYFALGAQYLDGNTHQLIDYQSAVFTPSEENGRSFRFEGDRTPRLFDITYNYQRHGVKFAESLVLLTDQRGEIIASNTTANWLLENLDELRKRNIGNFINKKCERVYPASPKRTDGKY